MMQCPSCGDGLNEITYEGVVIHTCESCGGELVCPDELRHIAVTKEVTPPPDALAEAAAHEPFMGVPVEESDRHITCPCCTSAMQVVNYGGDTNVYLDRCEQCGAMWADHLELERLQAIVEHHERCAPDRRRVAMQDLERRRMETASQVNRAFAGSRFAFVNAVINKVIDAAA